MKLVFIIILIVFLYWLCQKESFTQCVKDTYDILSKYPKTKYTPLKKCADPVQYYELKKCFKKKCDIENVESILNS